MDVRTKCSHRSIRTPQHTGGHGIPEGPCSFFALQSVRLAAGEERGSLVRSLTPRCLRTRVLTCLDHHNLSHLGFLDLQSVATSRSMSPWAPSGSPPSGGSTGLVWIAAPRVFQGFQRPPLAMDAKGGTFVAQQWIWRVVLGSKSGGGAFTSAAFGWKETGSLWSEQGSVGRVILCVHVRPTKTMDINLV